MGYHFLEVGKPPPLGYPLAILGLYQEPLRFDHLTGRSSAPIPGNHKVEPASARPTEVTFGLSADEYVRRVELVHDYLKAGDCYQINLTDAFDVNVPGDLLSLYLRLRRIQSTSYGAYLNFGNPTIASFSPELHFRVRGRELLTKPMKGTAGRGRTLAEDLEQRATLAADEKNRAENVMIVDLLRNDAGRLCRYGSVRVPELFGVEPFGSVLQMTSTVRGELRDEPRLRELFAKLFPSGSVTGAPKRRALEVIREIESRPRGVYTGAIGFAAPDGDMTFSVAIRTLVAGKTGGGGVGDRAASTTGPGRTVLGVGSGIVIDSSASEEYRECLLKAEFVNSSRPSFELLETMRSEEGVVSHAEKHLDRLRDSAAYFGFPFDRSEACRLLFEHSSERGTGTFRLRLSLRHDGLLQTTAVQLEESDAEIIVGLAGETVDSSDPFLFHKTSLRGRQERAMTAAGKLGLGEMIFINERGELTEGSVSNLFVEIGGRLLTPALTCGLLPGIGRANVLARESNAAEAVLRPRDLLDADAIFLCSSLRGMRRVQFRG